MHVPVARQVACEGLGSIQAWLTQANAHVTWTRLFESRVFPTADGPDLFIVLGGSVSVNDEKCHSCFVSKKQFVRADIDAGAPMLGICLGAQLIASACSARVYPGARAEIGWFPVYGEPVADGCFAFPDTASVFHWHRELLDLPPSDYTQNKAALRDTATQSCASVNRLMSDLLGFLTRDQAVSAGV